MSGQASSVRYDLTVSVIDGGKRVEARLPHDGKELALGFTSDGFTDKKFAVRLNALIISMVSAKRSLDGEFGEADRTAVAQAVGLGAYQ